LSQIEEFKVLLKKDKVTEVLKFRHKSRRYAYGFEEDLGPVYIRIRKGLFGKVDFKIGGGESDENGLQDARKIEIEHRGIRLKILLTELKRL
jgi:hypothetical protein